MTSPDVHREVAEFFKALGNESRLRLVQALIDSDRTVSELVEITGMSQPLVSQHLKVLRQIHLIASTRTGQTVTYSLDDHHVAHVVGDAFTHITDALADPRHSHDTQETS
ncbi:metalloregulator ArsR/SmtB family transcription factor [Actinomyces sp. B33]|uniref:ArsR/SmtB family transcription factor n=1 Tax=Actinomyces sp. B33 TaxID=2942131 RepID=UPI0023417764|nr:metalloregulator ArsR/SmtB family transcription factor [Actinomyces sp. B33]MDC4233144.1 metalloregulator ArsR/SmtB family transcription factor [Actinomyces sp. B33]